MLADVRPFGMVSCVPHKPGTLTYHRTVLLKKAPQWCEETPVVCTARTGNQLICSQRYSWLVLGVTKFVGKSDLAHG